MVGEHYLHSYYAPTSGTDTSPALAAFSVTFVSVCKAQSLDSTPAWKSVGWVTSICILVQPFLVIRKYYPAVTQREINNWTNIDALLDQDDIILGRQYG